MTGYQHYYGVCEDADHPPLVISVEVHPDAGATEVVPNPDEWQDFGIRCPVCGDVVDGGYEGADNNTRERERERLVRRAMTECTHLLVLGQERQDGSFVLVCGSCSHQLAAFASPEEVE